MSIDLPYNKEEVTIILEGMIRFEDVIDLRNTIKKYKELCKQIIISSYMDDGYESKLKEICPNIIILRQNIKRIQKKTDVKYGRIPDRHGNFRFKKRG